MLLSSWTRTSSTGTANPADLVGTLLEALAAATCSGSPCLSQCERQEGGSSDVNVLRAAKLVPVGFGIKKLQITCVIEDSKVESMDEIIEDQLVR